MLLLVSVFFSQLCLSQIKLKTYANKIEKGYEFLADNDEFCPVSVKVDFTLKNMKSSKGNHKVFVIPARTKGFLISKLTNVKRGRYGYSYKTKFNFGNYLKSSYDSTYVYDLPFKKGKIIKISQGYFGERTHKNERALDFSMPIGTDVYAARDGVVVKMVDNNTKTCYKKECAKFNNVILIYHVDGTFSSYAHIDTNSAKVKVGDKVEKGQLIAKSGNIGWSSGPHLHFIVYNQRMGRKETIETKFRIYEDGKPVILRQEGIYHLD